MKQLEWHNEKRKLKQLIQFEKNPRYLTEKQKEDLQKSLQKFNLAELPVINTDNKICAGHQRIKILSELYDGNYEIEVRVPNRKLTEKEFEEYNIRSNKNVGSWDMDMLANSFELPDLLEYGFDEKELIGLDFGDNTDGEKLEEVPEPQKKAISKLGDIFVIDGKHRVMCGDSTNSSHVEALMAGNKADMVFTDPPYNVDYEGYTKDKLTIKSDSMADDKYAEFLKAVFKNYVTAVKKGAGFYICHASSWQKLTEEMLNEAGIVIRNQIIWAKNTFAWGMGRYKFQHEPIFYAHLKGQSDSWYGDRKATTLWSVPKPAKSELHPTMKPIPLINIALINSSKAGDLILDLFGGSGSTLIASKEAHRYSYLMEFDPIYVDVILRRYKNLYPEAKFECSNRKFDFDKLFN